MPRSRQTHQPTPHALHPRQLRYSLPNWTPRPAFSTLCRLPAGTDHAAQPSHRHEQRAARRPAGRHSPTKPMLPTASIDANQAANASGLGAGSMPAAPRPAARRRPASRPPSSPKRVPISESHRPKATAAGIHSMQQLSERHSKIRQNNAVTNAHCARVRGRLMAY